MEDISSLIWLGIAVVWVLTRLIRRGAKKVARTQQKRPRPTVSRPTAPPTETAPTRLGKQPDSSGRGGTGPPPIVPR